MLTPIKDLGLPVVGVISDAEVAQRQAVATLWPDVPHQICQFHALREASRPMYELDHSIRTQVRKQVQKKLWAFRVTIEQRLQQARDGEARQLSLLQEYAAAIQAAIHVDGLAPFEYAGLKMDEALNHVPQSLQRLQKKGQQ